MDEAWHEFLVDLRAYIAIGAPSLVIGLLLLLMPSARRGLLPIRRLRPGRWTGSEVLLVLASAWLFVPTLVAALVCSLNPLLPRDNDSLGRQLQIYFNPLQAGLTLLVAYYVLRGHARAAQLGLTWARGPANIVLGIGLFLLVTPITLAIYFAATLPFTRELHPFEKLIGQGFPDWGWLFLVAMTVICAPLVEETVFRGVLQGWLRRATLIGHITLMAIVFALGARNLAIYDLAQGADESVREVLRPVMPPTRFDAAAPLVFTVIVLLGYGTWLWVLRRRYLDEQQSVWSWRPEEAAVGEPAMAPDQPDGEEVPSPPDIRLPLLPLRDPARQSQHHAWAWANARLAMYGSAMLFAVAHEPWPAPVPLFFFGLALGWLVYRTQSLIGAIVCHALFNGVACIVLYWSTWIAP